MDRVAAAAQLYDEIMMKAGIFFFLAVLTFLFSVFFNFCHYPCSSDVQALFFTALHCFVFAYHTKTKIVQSQSKQIAKDKYFFLSFDMP